MEASEALISSILAYLQKPIWCLFAPNFFVCYYCWVCWQSKWTILHASLTQVGMNWTITMTQWFLYIIYNYTIHWYRH